MEYPPKFQVAFIDVDNTVADTDGSLMADALAEIAAPPAIPDALETLRVGGTEALEQFLADLEGGGRVAMAGGWDAYARGVPLDRLRPVAGALEYVAKLREREIRVTFLTRGPAERAASKLRVLGLGTEEGLIAGCDRPGSKTTAMAAACREEGIEPHHCVMVGDDPIEDAALPTCCGFGALWRRRGRDIPAFIAMNALVHVFDEFSEIEPAPYSGPLRPCPDYREWLQRRFAGDKGEDEQDRALRQYYFETGHVERLARMVTLLERLGPHGQVVEVGTHGVLLAYLRERGLAREVLGIQKELRGWLLLERGHFTLADRPVSNAVPIVPHNATDLPTGTAELILAFEVLEHLDDPFEALVRWRALAAENGKLVLSTPNPCAANAVARALIGEHPYFYPPYHTELGRPTHVRELSPRDLDLLLRAAGWVVAERTSFDHAERDGWDHSALVRTGATQPGGDLRAWRAARAHAARAIAAPGLPPTPRGDYQLVVATRGPAPDPHPPLPLYRRGRRW